MLKKKIHIILIDDYQNGRETFRDILECWGYSVKPVCGGREAVELLGKGAYDLVITNLTELPRIDILRRTRNGIVPDMTNVEVLKEVKKRNPALPVIVLDPYGSADSATKAIRQGAADYIRRPFSVEELRSRIELVLQKCTDCSVEDKVTHL